MNDLICPLCAHQSIILNNCDLKLKDIIYRYLQITIKQEYTTNVCQNCEMTLLNFDEFAQKCQAAQSSLKENFRNTSTNTNVKLEADNKIEIKIENPEMFYDEFEDSADNYYVYKDDLKPEDPLLSTGSVRRSKHSSRVKKEIKIEDGNSRKHRKIAKLKMKKEKKLGEKNAVKKKRQISNPSIIKNICHICDFQSPGWKALEMHCLNEHSTKPKVLCVCGDFLTTERTVQNHKKKHDETRAHKCEHCGKCFSYIGNYEVHMASHMSEDQFNFTCSVCPKKCINKVSLDKHMKIHQKENHSCDICGKIYTTKCGLSIHKITAHQDNKDHICDECGIAFSTKGGLNQHKNVHIAEGRHKCTLCDKGYKTKYMLTLHNESVHLGLVFKCPECPVVLKNRKNLLTHKRLHTNNVLKFACTLCDKRFRRSYRLKMHMNSHDGLRPYVCQWCSAAYSSNVNLKNHKQREHPQKFEEECKIEIDINIHDMKDTSCEMNKE